MDPFFELICKLILYVILDWEPVYSSLTGEGKIQYDAMVWCNSLLQMLKFSIIKHCKDCGTERELSVPLQYISAYVCFEIQVGLWVHTLTTIAHIQQGLSKPVLGNAKSEGRGSML